jgi:acetolactate synthase-1/2/3 large subunit
MAEGCAAVTGELGVAVIGRGPATANDLHGAIYANRTGSKVLVISGEAPVRSGNPTAPVPDYKGFAAAAEVRSRLRSRS